MEEHFHTDTTSLPLCTVRGPHGCLDTHHLTVVHSVKLSHGSLSQCWLAALGFKSLSSSPALPLKGQHLLTMASWQKYENIINLMIKKTLERARGINCIFNHSRCEYRLLELIFGSRDLKGGSLFFTPFIGTFVRLCPLQSLSFAPSKLNRKIGGSWGDYLATKFLALQGSVLVDPCRPPADACPSLCSVSLSLLPSSN